MSFLFGTEVIFKICDKKGSWNVAVKLGLKTLPVVPDVHPFIAGW